MRGSQILIQPAHEDISAAVSGMTGSAFLLKYRVHNIMISVLFLLCCACVHVHKGAAVPKPVLLHKFCSDYKAEGRTSTEESRSLLAQFSRK